jgi:AcrR family transcriptional regulator
MPKLSPKTQAERRARILDAAELCFARSGFHGATMQDICRAAGVSAGALYVYFRSKEDLIEGLSLRDRDELRVEFARAADSVDLVEGLARVLGACVLDEPEHKAQLFLEMGAEATRNPAVARSVRACDLDVHAALSAALRDAAERGQIAPVLPIADLAELMAVVVHGLFWRRAIDPDFDAARMAPHVLRMFGAMMGLAAADLERLAPMLEGAHADATRRDPTRRDPKPLDLMSLDPLAPASEVAK